MWEEPDQLDGGGGMWDVRGSRLHPDQRRSSFKSVSSHIPPPTSHIPHPENETRHQHAGGAGVFRMGFLNRRAHRHWNSTSYRTAAGCIQGKSMELRGVEPLTSAVRLQRSPN